MKRKNNLYFNSLKYDNANIMFKKIKKACRNREAVYNYSINKCTNIIDLLNKLYTGKYTFDKYRIFMIKDPKYRIIMSENVKDKLANHIVSKYILLPSLEPKLIDTNVATRKNKGSKYAFNKFLSYLDKLKYENKEIYVLKLDIKKYFYNIDHSILIKLLKRYIKDKYALYTLENIINSTNEEYVNNRINYLKELKIKDLMNSKLSKKEKEMKIDMVKSIPIYKKGKGLPIGNMTSQILAIFYLNDVDHYIKEVLKFKYYIRYMDDILIVDTDKEKLKKSFKLIEGEINKLNLELNSKSNLYKMSNGISFLGYKFIIKNNKTIIKYNNQTIRRIDRKLKILKEYDYELYEKSYGSYQGYFKYSNTKLKNKYFIEG